MNLRRPTPLSAFTLIELLAVIAIVGILAAIVIPVVSACRAASARTVELSAARQLMSAYLLTPADNHGVLLPQSGSFAGQSFNEAGQVITLNITASAWPHRLRTYLGDRFKNTLYLGDQADYYDELVANGGGSMTDYALIRSPSFGMNGQFVGGNGALMLDSPVRRFTEAAAPSRLIAFASAHDRTLNEKSGFWRVIAPVYGWPSADLNGIPDQKSLDAAYGHVAYRHSGKAVVAYLDGHVEMQGSADLRDMRLWSDAAYRANNPGYVPPALP